MRRMLSIVVLAAALAGCGGGGSSSGNPEEVPAGIPALTGGFVNWWDVQATPGHRMGVVNATLEAVVSIDVYTTAGVVTFPEYVAAGELWLDVDGDVAPGFLLVRCHGASGRTYARYFRYDGAGSDAAVVARGNWEFD